MTCPDVPAPDIVAMDQAIKNAFWALDVVSKDLPELLCFLQAVQVVAKQASAAELSSAADDAVARVEGLAAIIGILCSSLTDIRLNVPTLPEPATGGHHG